MIKFGLLCSLCFVEKGTGEDNQFGTKKEYEEHMRKVHSE